MDDKRYLEKLNSFIWTMGVLLLALGFLSFPLGYGGVPYFQGAVMVLGVGSVFSCIRHCDSNWEKECDNPLSFLISLVGWWNALVGCWRILWAMFAALQFGGRDAWLGLLFSGLLRAVWGVVVVRIGRLFLSTK